MVRGTCYKRAFGTVFTFDDEMKILPNVGNFLSSSKNKDNLNRFLAQKFASYNNSPPVFAVTYSDEISFLDKALM